MLYLGSMKVAGILSGGARVSSARATLYLGAPFHRGKGDEKIPGSIMSKQGLLGWVSVYICPHDTEELLLQQFLGRSVAEMGYGRCSKGSETIPAQNTQRSPRAIVEILVFDWSVILYRIILLSGQACTHSLSSNFAIFSARIGEVEYQQFMIYPSHSISNTISAGAEDTFE